MRSEYHVDLPLLQFSVLTVLAAFAAISSSASISNHVNFEVIAFRLILAKLHVQILPSNFHDELSRNPNYEKCAIKHKCAFKNGADNE
ncbi:hypothetical protein EGR_03988 [Echinococcus granulosus]|uniref:Uncharacterized protein n=1 Tax=Echinococcus granulosus TaxID=6210 RepID=W6UI30_ECHGR|nr:hypothetical protein EGR_03988 [Echinococcus granulosus]EUB61140.1 hypothetical protein EGR_03988 [Echinococcus granulosus]